MSRRGYLLTGTPPADAGRIVILDWIGWEDLRQRRKKDGGMIVGMLQFLNHGAER